MRGLTKRSRDKENNESSIRLAKKRQEIFQLKIRSASVGFLIPSDIVTVTYLIFTFSFEILKYLQCALSSQGTIPSFIICNYAYLRNAKSSSHYSPLSIGLSFDKGVCST
jgi:hypothetical protein